MRGQLPDLLRCVDALPARRESAIVTDQKRQNRNPLQAVKSPAQRISIPHATPAHILMSEHVQEDRSPVRKGVLVRAVTYGVVECHLKCDMSCNKSEVVCITGHISNDGLRA